MHCLENILLQSALFVVNQTVPAWMGKHAKRDD